MYRDARPCVSTKLMTLYQNKYRIESARLKGYDYSSPGGYFITICTKNHIEWFGVLEIGDIARAMWSEIPHHHLHIQLDEYVIMPNHIHGIIIICENDRGRDVACNVSTGDMARISPKHKSLGVVIRSYKSAVSNWCHTHGHPDFMWQPRFYDHIIRDEKGLNDVREYIYNNPMQWDNDRNHPNESLQWS